MKFQDIALLGVDAPARIAVVPERKELGTYLGVLSQSAKVVDEGASDETLRRLAEAA
jgi:ribosomal protein L7Ae-like RNA K-turn-binding protein